MAVGFVRTVNQTGDGRKSGTIERPGLGADLPFGEADVLGGVAVEDLRGKRVSYANNGRGRAERVRLLENQLG